MAVNLINIMVDRTPIDELKVIKNEDSTFELPLNISAKYPPFSKEIFTDHPNEHMKMQNGMYYEREKVYKNKGNSNVESSKNNTFVEVRRNEFAENASHTPIRVDSAMTKEILELNLRSKKFNSYPMDKDNVRYPKPMEVWKDDRNVNLILEDSYYSTSINRGRSEVSFNEEFIIGKFFKPLRKEKLCLKSFFSF